MTKLTTLLKPSPLATLLLYLAASPTTVNAVLVKEKEHENKMKQFLVYFISEVLSRAKLDYSELEKIAYTVVMHQESYRIISKLIASKSSQCSHWKRYFAIAKALEESENGPQS